MARVIKSFEDGAGHARAFKNDLRELQSVESVKAEPAGVEELDPARVLAEARSEAQRKIEEAYQVGYQRGAEAGREEFLASVAAAATALGQAGEAMQEAREAFIASLEPQVVDLACAIAQRIIRRELRLDPHLVAGIVRGAIENLADRERMRVHLNPADIEALQAQGMSLLEELRDVAHFEVVADESVEPGGCSVNTESIHADATLDTQLRKLMDALLD